MADDVQERRTEPQVEPTPKEPANGRRQDEHGVAAGQVDRRVEQGGQGKPRRARGPRRRPFLKETPPEELFSRPDDQTEEEDDASNGRSRFQGVDPVDAGRGKGEESEGGRPTGGKDGVENGRGGDTERDLADKAGAEVFAEPAAVAPVDGELKAATRATVRARQAQKSSGPRRRRRNRAMKRIAASAAAAATALGLGPGRFSFIPT